MSPSNVSSQHISIPLSSPCLCTKLSYMFLCAYPVVSDVLWPFPHTCSYTIWPPGGSSVHLKQGFQPLFQSLCSELLCFPPKSWRKSNAHLSSCQFWGFVSLQTNVKAASGVNTVCVCTACEPSAGSCLRSLCLLVTCDHTSLFSQGRHLHLYSTSLCTPFTHRLLWLQLSHFRCSEYTVH